MPELMIPWPSRAPVFHNADMMAVVSHAEEKTIRCWLLDIANHCWHELPYLVSPGYTRFGFHINFWIKRNNHSNFQVFVITSTYGPVSVLHTISAASNSWHTIEIPQPEVPLLGSLYLAQLSPNMCALSKIGYILVDYAQRAWLWEGTHDANPLPLPWLRSFGAIADPESDFVFGCTSRGELDSELGTFQLFRLDECNSRWIWECVVSGLPQGCMPSYVKEFQILESKIIRNEVLISIGLISYRRSLANGNLWLPFSDIQHPPW